MSGVEHTVATAQSAEKEADYKFWWEQAERLRSEIEALLDQVLGTEEEDGSGLGLVGDVALAIAKSQADALRTAADALEGGLGIKGTPRNVYEFRLWLRLQADAIDLPGQWS